MKKIKNFTQFLNENLGGGGTTAAKILRCGNYLDLDSLYDDEEAALTIDVVEEIASFLGCSPDLVFEVNSDSWDYESREDMGPDLKAVNTLADDIEGTGGERWVKSIVVIDGVEIPCVEEINDIAGGFWVYMFNAKDLYRIAEGQKLKPDAEFLDTLGLLKADKGEDMFENFK